MTGSVLPFDASTHTVVDALLPFYVNATLRSEELAFVEPHIQSCEKCQREVAWLHELFDACATFPMWQGNPRSASDPVEGAEDHANRGDGWRRTVTGWQAIPSWTRWLIAAQFSAIILLGTVFATSERDEPSFRTLGAAGPSAQIPDAVAVMFDPAITAPQIRQIILGAGARIVDGPTPADVFVLELPAGRTEQALQALRAERAVRLAEPLGPRTGR
jgi:anti-sigma factor RsiW